MKRNYCRDRKTGEYVYLLDRYLNFEGTGTFSPLMEKAAIELAIQGPSYRKAARTLETLLGYRVISHETIRKHLLEVSSIPKRESVHQPALFVEVDVLYVKEVKISAVHQGWEVNGERVRLKNKRYFIHDGKEPFWEAFEEFLMETFDDDPTVHKLVINGDGAAWITACREYLKTGPSSVSTVSCGTGDPELVPEPSALSAYDKSARRF
nr:UPF0236 family protein [Caldibacillus debilis]